ncbi:MAG: AsmA-like C-terminal region-containing protein [Terriglobia bacterium]
MQRKKLGLALLALLGLALLALFLPNLDVVHQRMRRALERQLGRSVEYASLSARLLPRPEVVARGVVLHEREEFGAEPFLFADQVRAHLALRSLWRGRLEFSRVHFVRPSINLVRKPEHGWNLAAFLDSNSAVAELSAASGSNRVISAAEGRINFKLDVDKHVFALRDVRFRLEPLADGRWRLQLEAIPMRGDRRLREMASVRLEGQIGPAAEFSAAPFRFRWSLENGSLARLWTLSTGREPPLRADVSLAGLLEGTPAEWSTEGTLAVASLRRWDLLAPPRTPAWEGKFRARWAAQEPAIALESLSLRGPRSALAVTGRVENPFGGSRWDLRVNAERLALDELLEQLAALKAGVSEEARLTGEAEGVLSVRGRLRDWQGELSVSKGVKLRAPGLTEPVELGDLRLHLERGRLALLPLTVRFSPQQTVTVSGEVRLQPAVWPYRLHWQSEGVELSKLQQTASVFGWELLAPTRWQGPAQVDLEWQGEVLGGTEPRWRGEARLQSVAFHPPELADPLEIVQARLAWQGAGVKVEPLVVQVGENKVSGSLERRGRRGQWRVNLAAERLSLEELDNLLHPARPGLLGRLVGRQPCPASRGERLHVAGAVRVKELLAGPFLLSGLSLRGEWQSGWLELARVRFRAYEGRFNGRLQADFRAQPPRYRLAGNLKGLQLAPLLSATTDWGELFTGTVGAELTLQTAGTQPRELWRELQGLVVGAVVDGSLAHLNLRRAMAEAAGLDGKEDGDDEPTQLQSLAGDFRLGDGEVEFEGARLILPGAALELSGRADFEGRLDLRLRGEPLRVAGRRPTARSNRILSFSYHVGGSLRRPLVRAVETLPAAEASR